MEVTPQKIFELTTLLNSAVAQAKSRGIEKAEADYAYRVALTKEILVLRADKHPATLIRDVARGNKDVAKLKLESNIADALYDSCIEAINSYKLQIRVLEGQLQREWTQSGNR